MPDLMDDFFFARAYENDIERWQPWWELVFAGDEWAMNDETMQRVLGPEYFFALDRGLQP